MWFLKTKKRKKSSKKITEAKKMQFSKKWLTIIMVCSIFWITFSYILAFMDKAEIAQELSDGIVKVVIAALLGYFLKSFFETREEEKNKIKYKEMEIMNTMEPDACGDPDVVFDELDETF